MNNCLFCKIIKGEIPADKVYEDETCFAFLDVNPINPGHVLLVPKKHYKNIYVMPDDVLSKMAPVIKRLAVATKKATGAGGINIGMNNDPIAGQVIFHAHIHIMPRFSDDNHKMWHGIPYPSGESPKTAEKIKELL